MKRSAIVLPWAGLLAMTSIAWACDSTPHAAAKSASPVAASKAKTQSVAKAACPTTPTCGGMSCCAAMAAAVTKSAAEAAPAAQAAAPQADAPAQAGMRIYLDPENGTLSPVPVGPDAAADASKADFGTEVLKDPVQTVLPDGSVMIELNGHGQEYFMMNIDKDGKRTTKCVEDPKAASQAPVAPKPEDK